MVNFVRHPRRLSACAHSKVSAQVSKFPNYGSAFLLQGHAVRVGACPFRLLQASGIPVVSSKGNGNSGIGVFRRLGHLVSVGSSCPSGLSEGNQGVRVPGFSCERREIGSYSHAKSKVARSGVGREGGQVLLAGRVCRGSVGVTRKGLPSVGGYKTYLGTAGRQTSLRRSDSAQGDAVLPRSGSPALVSGREQGRACKDSRHASKGTDSVEGWHPLEGVCSDSAGSSVTDSLDRCVQLRMGSTVVGAQDGKRAVVSGGERFSHKQLGIVSGWKGYRSARFRTCFSNFCNRQCGDGGGHSQPGVTEHVNSEGRSHSLRDCETKEGVSQGVENPGDIECCSGFAVTGSSNPDGMGAAHEGVSALNSGEGTDRDRSVRDSVEPQSKEFCICVRASRSNSGRCIHSRVERLESDLSVSTAQVIDSSNRASSGVSSPRVNCGAEARKCSVVPVSPISGRRVSVTRESGAGCVGRDSKSTLLLLRSLDRFQFLRSVFGRSYPPNVARMLASAYRPSSNRQAEVAWRALKAWLPANVSDISKSLVMSFFNYLFEERGLSPRTVLGYKASLALPLKLGFNIDVKESEFGLLAKAQFLARPPRTKIVPQWSVSAALAALKEPRFSRPDIASNDLFLKTLFLVALASGNRVSELAALDRSAIKWERELAGVTIPVRQGFLYKNQSLTRIPPKVFFPALKEPKALCPVACLKDYLEDTAHHNDASRVFLHPVSFAPLNAGSISFWLCRAITELVPGSIPRAHDVRKLSYSLAWVRGVPIEEIVKRGFWSSVNVFINKYLVTIPAEVQCVAGASSS